METQLSTFKGRSQSVWETSLHMIWVTGMYVCIYLWLATKILHGQVCHWAPLKAGHTEQADHLDTLKIKILKQSWVLWYPTVIPTLRKLRQKVSTFRANQGCIARLSQTGEWFRCLSEPKHLMPSLTT